MIVGFCFCGDSARVSLLGGTVQVYLGLCSHQWLCDFPLTHEQIRCICTCVSLFYVCSLDHGGFVCFLFLFLKMGTCWPRIQNSSYPASRVLGSKACTSRPGLYGVGKGIQDLSMLGSHLTNWAPSPSLCECLICLVS